MDKQKEDDRGGRRSDVPPPRLPGALKLAFEGSTSSPPPRVDAKSRVQGVVNALYDAQTSLDRGQAQRWERFEDVLRRFDDVLGAGRFIPVLSRMEGAEPVLLFETATMRVLGLGCFCAALAGGRGHLPPSSPATVSNCSRAARRSSTISCAITPGAGRFSDASRLSSLSQKMSSEHLSRAMSSA